ncbi:MucBP domain-containing protein [Weissella coleopterorum]|uniref:MucBP domain-containing protein n=1 Tax=Weissella coleopterorum TaxID=2714949 RepID=A0A6G8AYJ7_9LACO|nr:MucBP domain-containing protein [Weissella coleopterorum]QIL50039.1 MucBP domain-containing protein [Weissella coleopterorum]
MKFSKYLLLSTTILGLINPMLVLADQNTSVKGSTDTNSSSLASQTSEQTSSQSQQSSMSSKASQTKQQSTVQNNVGTSKVTPLESNKSANKTTKGAIDAEQDQAITVSDFSMVGTDGERYPDNIDIGTGTLNGGVYIAGAIDNSDGHINKGDTITFQITSHENGDNNQVGTTQGSGKLDKIGDWKIDAHGKMTINVQDDLVGRNVFSLKVRASGSESYMRTTMTHPSEKITYDISKKNEFHFTQTLVTNTDRYHKLSSFTNNSSRLGIVFGQSDNLEALNNGKVMPEDREHPNRDIVNMQEYNITQGDLVGISSTEIYAALQAVTGDGTATVINTAQSTFNMYRNSVKVLSSSTTKAELKKQIDSADYGTILWVKRSANNGYLAMKLPNLATQHVKNFSIPDPIQYIIDKNFNGVSPYTAAEETTLKTKFTGDMTPNWQHQSAFLNFADNTAANSAHFKSIDGSDIDVDSDQTTVPDDGRIQGQTTVKVHYIDVNGNEIANAAPSYGYPTGAANPIDGSISTDVAEAKLIDIPKYLKKGQADLTTQGQAVVGKNQVLTSDQNIDYPANGTTNVYYVYKPITVAIPTKPVAESTVTAKYVDESGKDLTTPVILTDKAGATYQTEQKNFAGYTFKEVKGNPKGKFTAQNQTVTYIYSQNVAQQGQVTVKYVDEAGK